MALPRLNNQNPVYEMVIPSTKQTVKYRPFLVKEQKNLLIAMESQEPRQLMNAMLACLEACVSDVNASKLSTFDVDYMFTQVRSKSVGETTKIGTKCLECDAENDISINLADIKMTTDLVKDPEIKLTDDIILKMKYPSYDDMMKSDTLFTEDAKVVDLLFDTMVNCMHSVQTNEDNILFKDETREEIESFVNSLTTSQMELITAFVDSLPTLEHEQEYVCGACGKVNELSLKGLQDFF